jgi:diguanylate cyclase (GGDEF)-like protein
MGPRSKYPPDVASVSEAQTVTGAQTVTPAGGRRLRWWALLAAVLVLGATTGAAFAARSVVDSNAARSRESLKQSSQAVASSLKLAIQRERDLVITAAGFFLGDPHASSAQFQEWSASVQALQRFPELLSWGDIVLVPASGLDKFAARLAGATNSAATVSFFRPIPSGARPYYCLVAALQHRPAQPAAPAALDYCAGGALATLRDSGHWVYTAVNLGQGHILGLDVPFYRGGGVPATEAARRAAFVGWMGMSFAPSVLLDAALAGHPRTAVALRFRSASAGGAFAASTAVFRAGKAPAHAVSSTIELQDGWSVQTFAAAGVTGLFGNVSALALLIAGAALGIVLGLLVLVLGTGRARALRLVGERTGELHYQAVHDALTGLPNRTLIMDRIEQLLMRSRRAKTAGAALYVDLDEFKNVNDSLGHAAGDRLLVAVAARLTSALREADTIGRMGGDEFVVLIDGGEMATAPELVAERLLEVMHEPFQLEPTATPIIINTSIGIAVGDRASAGELLRDADVALYQAKGGGKNRYQTFNRELQANNTERIGLEFDLRSALEGEQLRLLYQPIYNLEDLTIVGVEALLRWQHPTLGLLQPDRFIPILEHTGQIREVGRWVLHKACEQMAAWHARGDTLDISVNVAAAQLDSDAIVDHIRGALTISGLGAGSLIIEVTETALMKHADATAHRLQAIKDIGVRVAVDDFGTGYSSLAYLQRFPVDCLKIDRMFTSAMTAAPESRALIGTLIQLGKDLGLRTLAEGVETPSQLNYLRQGHVDEIQGFLLSRPLEPEDLETQILAPSRPQDSWPTRPPEREQAPRDGPQRSVSNAIRAGRPRTRGSR